MFPLSWLVPAALMAAGIATGLGWWIARRRAQALDRVARGLRALDEGRPVSPIRGRFLGAAGRLCATFNAVIPGLEERIARLEEDRQLLRAVLGGMTGGVIAIDSRRRLLFANDAAAALFGLGPDAVGRPIAEVIRSPRVQDAVNATLTGPEPHQAEISVPAPDGRDRGQGLILAVQGTPLPGSPPAGAVLVCHDVTETRRLERVRQDFVANASHELKTPLAAIRAYTETLLDGALHDERVNAKFLRRIEEQADRLNSLVLDLLSLARLESGEEFFQHGPLELAPLVRQVVESHRARAESQGLDYGFDLDASAEPAIVQADEEAIRSILENLIDNAIKYTPAGGRVRIGLRQPGAEAVLLEVADSGIGIAREALPRVFERFYRVDKARSRELGGTGLGLSIVKHLVQSLGGQIAVESRVGLGSTFTVRLPDLRPAREGGRPARAGSGAVPPAGPGPPA